MKRLYFGLGIALVIFAIIFCGTKAVRGAEKDMKNEFFVLQKCVEKNDFESAEKLAGKAEKKWVIYEKNLSFFVNHAEVCEIGVTLSQLKPLIKARQKGDINAQIKKAQTLLLHLANIENITH